MHLYSYNMGNPHKLCSFSPPISCWNRWVLALSKGPSWPGCSRLLSPCLSVSLGPMPVVLPWGTFACSSMFALTTMFYSQCVYNTAGFLVGCVCALRHVCDSVRVPESQEEAEGKRPILLLISTALSASLNTQDRYLFTSPFYHKYMLVCTTQKKNQQKPLALLYGVVFDSTTALLSLFVSKWDVLSPWWRSKFGCVGVVDRSGVLAHLAHTLITGAYTPTAHTLNLERCQKASPHCALR